MIKEFNKLGKNFAFEIDNPEDTIQRCHARGFFYEEAELLDLSLSVPNFPTVIDIGANVGNHSVFFAKCMNASKVFCIEPNPKAISILNKNIRLNNVESVCDFSFLGIALSDEVSSGNVLLPNHLAANLGAAEIEISENGLTKVVPGDFLFSELNCVDLLKIDVEGFEMKVLSGLSSTIRKFKPVVYVEVRDCFIPEFKNWLHRFEYRIDRTHFRHKGHKNYLCLPF